VPLAMAAATMGVPVFLHEQNAVPGLANRLLSRWATTVFQTFPEMGRKMAGRSRIIHSGLPIRQEIMKVNTLDGLKYFHLAPDVLTVLVTGGSGGARRLNEVMLGVYHILATTEHRPLQFVHLTGRAEFDNFCRLMTDAGINEEKVGKIVIRPYLEEMGYGLAAADVMISRAGAATIAELTARGLPAILIPYPYAAGDHQFHNADYLVKMQAAVMIPESSLTPDRLFEELERLLGDAGLRKSIGNAARSLGRPQAGEIIARMILRAVGDC
jgi:UDP-N-acetylglucosamine--N-acetylmuramyl-(pentapeptide) pyrophosphoryl-undecaprenol N-acetylglucosamine transferase